MLVRRLARPMLSAIFISGGIDALRHPAPTSQVADPVAPKIASSLPFSLPEDTEQLIKIDAAVKIVAGGMLATNRLPRLAAFSLACSLIPTTFAGHRFWEETDASTKRNQQNHFFKNVGLLGGLLLAAVDTEGRPSLGWRARRTAKVARVAAGGAAGKIGDALPVG